MSNSQWHADQGEGERSLANAERIRVAEQLVVSAVLELYSAKKSGKPGRLAAAQEALDDAVTSLQSLRVR